MSGLRIARWIWGLLLVGAFEVGVFAQDVGFEGPSYSGADGSPTESKPQSKVWWNDGSWWACMWDASAQSFMIHRLERPAQTWVDTGTAVDNRFKSHSDCLWDGTKLYIACHSFTSGTGTGGHPLQLYRYSYNPVTDVYSLDTGFPVQFGAGSTETLVIDKDSTGTIWAVWKFNFRVWVAHTLGDDRSWSVPRVHPRSTSNFDSDDICSVIKFQGNKIGVMWSDNIADDFKFTFHSDGAPDTTWSTVELPLSGAGMADDHINLKATADGRLFAIVKTGTDEIRLLVRSAGGTWTSNLVSAASAGWTRPIILLDEEDREIRAYAASPILGGSIYRKISNLDTIAFPAGIGTVVIRSDGDETHDDPSSTKQSVTGVTGVVVLASHHSTQQYWHAFGDLGGSPPAAPVAAFSADPATGYEPLQVQFLDSSIHAPSAWLWNFGDGATSTAQHPVHVYANDGTYNVTLQVTNGLGQNTLVKNSYITVQVPPTHLTLSALEDAYVREFSPNDNYGAETFLRIRDDVTSDYHGYVKFFVPPTGNQVASATLRLFVNDASPDGGTIHPVSNGWIESTITWATAPSIGGLPVGGLGNVVLGTWAELDVSSVVTGSGTKSFGIQSLHTNSVLYSSREGVNPPQLDLTLEPPSATLPVANFEVNRSFGYPPLTVQFADNSSGVVDSWSWTFGDGGTSTLQNPSHVYQQRGNYTVTLTVTNAQGPDTETKTGFIRVTAPVRNKTGNLPTRNVDLPQGIPLTNTAPPHVRGAIPLEMKVGRRYPSGFPFPAGATGTLESAAREISVQFEFAGTLEKAVDFYSRRLLKRGILVRGETVHGGDESIRGVTLDLIGVGGTGTLELRPSDQGGVEGTLFLTLP